MSAAALFFQLCVQLGTPFLLATLGGILCERVGHLNLGIEGMMIVGALLGFRCAYYTNSVLLAVLCAGCGGLLLACVYAILTVTLRADQTVTGFSITIFGTGFANFVGKDLASLVLDRTFAEKVGAHALPGLTKLPFVGTVLFEQSAFIPLSLLAAVLLYFYFRCTRAGLAARMVGENPAVADASGIHVTRCKYLHILLGGFLCGLAGGYLSLVYVPRWQDDITAGMGWVAVALVIFSTWNPLKAILGAYLFGVLKGLAIKYQGFSIACLGTEITLSSQIMDMLPYVMTIVVLILTTCFRSSGSQAPASLGKPYFREER
mgnify:CR=1 FL=1